MSATVTVSTSVILAPTQSTPGNYIVYFPNIGTNGRLITVRDNDGYASTNHAVVLSTIGGAQFQTGVDSTQSQIFINQPFGFITLNSQASGRYTILNTFAFPEGSAAALVSQVTTNNLVTSTLQMIDIGTQSTNTFFTSTGFMYLNSNVMGQVSQQQLNSTVTGLGTSGYISTIVIPNITPALNITTGFTSNQYYNNTKDPLGSIVYSVENQIPPLWKNATSGYSYGFSNGGNDVVVGTPFIVAVGDSYASESNQSYIQISADGSNWNYALTSLSSPQVRLRVSYANGLYHAVGSNGSAGGTPTIMWSRDGSTWSNSVYTTGSGRVDPFIGLNGYARGITYGNGKWVAVGYQPGLAKYSIINSIDGSNWRESGPGVDLSIQQVWDVGFNGINTFLALCAENTSGGNIVRSVDGVTWTNPPAPFASSNFGIDSTNGGYIAGYGSTWLLTASNFAPSGKMLWRSADNGDTWSAVPSFNSGLLSRPYWDGALWWIGYSESNASNAPSIYYSTDDGSTWSSNFAGSNSFVGGFPQGFASRNAQSNFAQALLSTTIALSSNQYISSLQTNTISTNSITAATMTVSSLFVQVEVISTSFETINTISTVISDYTSTKQLLANQTFGSSLQISTVGIRTATPQAALDVNGNAYISSGLTLAGNVAYGSLKLNSGTAETAMFIQDPGRADLTGWLTGESINFASISTFGINRVVAGTVQPNVGLFIASNGNVGLSNTTPATKLVVENGGLTALTGIGVRFTDVYTVIGNWSDAYGSIQTTRLGNVSTIGTTPWDLVLQPLGGNIGIGSIDPVYPLDVNGQVWARSTLLIGSSVNNNQLRFYGTNGDGAGSFNHTVIAEHLYEGTETSELLLFKGDNPPSGIGPDRVRVLTSGGFQVDVGGNMIWSEGTAPPTATYISSIFVSGTNGNVGIRTGTPLYALDVTGEIRASGNITAFSDIRHKENIFRIENALSSVKEMRGVFYNPIGQSTQRVGVIAQEIENVLPQVVCTDTTEQANKSVAYGNITAILIEAVKELSAKVDALSKK